MNEADSRCQVELWNWVVGRQERNVGTCWLIGVYRVREAFVRRQRKSDYDSNSDSNSRRTNNIRRQIYGQIFFSARRKKQFTRGMIAEALFPSPGEIKWFCERRENGTMKMLLFYTPSPLPPTSFLTPTHHEGDTHKSLFAPRNLRKTTRLLMLPSSSTHSFCKHSYILLINFIFLIHTTYSTSQSSSSLTK